jgi:hypothetical protein
MSILSVYSRWTVPTQRSANAFARGARGVRGARGARGRSLDHRDAGPGEHRVEGSGEFRVPVAEQEPQGGHPLVPGAIVHCPS